MNPPPPPQQLKQQEEAMSTQKTGKHRRTTSCNLENLDLSRRKAQLQEHDSPAPKLAYSPKSLRNMNNRNMQTHRQQRMPARPVQDDVSVVSSLKCGSIIPDKNYDPAKDPMNRPFIPPFEITVKILVPVPDWLQMNDRSGDDDIDTEQRQQPDLMIPSMDRHHSPPRRRRQQQQQQEKPPILSSRQKSNQTAATEATSSMSKYFIFNENKAAAVAAIFVSPTTSKDSILDKYSLHTTPTDDSSDTDVDTVRLSPHRQVPAKRRRGLVRTEIKHIISKMPLFHSSARKGINLRRARGCLA